MARWYVELEERLTYNLEIEADTLHEAEAKAFEAESYVNNEWDDTDTVIVAIGAMLEPEPVPEPEREHAIVVNDDNGNSAFAYLVYEVETGYNLARFAELSQAQDFIIMIEGK